MRIILSVAVLSLVISASPSAGQSDIATTPTPAALVAEARQVFEQSLVDYRGARFMDVSLRTIEQDGQTRHVFCGQVNSPNRMGGMSGWKPFRLTIGVPVFMALMVEPVTDSVCPVAIAVDQTDYAPALSGS